MSAAEPNRQFVDTNVLVYAHDTGAGLKRGRAEALLKSLWETGEGCLSLQVLQEFFVTATGKLTQPLADVTATKIVAAYSRWTLHEPGRDDLLTAIDLHARWKISFWDALVVRSASRLGCKTIWTEDLKDGETYEGVRVKNPFK
jgi:predicted nucleic acid-binding protein